jgi:hypothetical protein
MKKKKLTKQDKEMAKLAKNPKETLRIFSEGYNVASIQRTEYDEKMDVLKRTIRQLMKFLDIDFEVALLIVAQSAHRVYEKRTTDDKRPR